MTPRILDREIVRAGYLTVERLKIRLPDGAEVSREVERHGDAVAVLPYDPQRRCALVIRQFRAPVFEVSGEASLEEACAGMIDREDAEAAIRREASEELGLALGPLEFVARVWSSCGVSTERQSLFLASYAAQDRIGAGGGLTREHEDITVVERPLSALHADLESGRIVDSKLLILVLELLRRRPDLFA